jgi:hypothetical protein
MNELKEAFCGSIPFLWLCNILKNNNNEIYHGELGKILHNTFIDDPRPYRKNVKFLLNNLLNWVKVLDIKNIKIDRPEFSERISLVAK